MTALADALLAELTDDQLAVLAERLRPFLRDDQAASADTLLSPAAAAATLGVHAKTLTRAARDGRVPGARRVGHGWRFDPALLELLPVTPERIAPSPPRERRRGAAPPSVGSSAVAAIRSGGTTAAGTRRPSTPETTA